MNHFSLIGNLTSDPEIVKLGESTKVNFSIAYNDPYVKDKEKSASFFNCEMWGKTAETFAKWHAKGDRVAISGRILQERWEKDGQKRSIIKLKCENYTNVKTSKGAASGNSSDSGISEEDAPF